MAKLTFKAKAENQRIAKLWKETQQGFRLQRLALLGQPERIRKALERQFFLMSMAQDKVLKEGKGELLLKFSEGILEILRTEAKIEGLLEGDAPRVNVNVGVQVTRDALASDLASIAAKLEEGKDPQELESGSDKESHELAGASPAEAITTKG